MYLRLKPIIKWLACDELLLTMPMSFRRNVVGYNVDLSHERNVGDQSHIREGVHALRSK